MPYTVTFGAIELIVLCAFMCSVECFVAQSREILVYK